ncbi:14498_t:CDS:1, partial [Racocetra fulgida]
MDALGIEINRLDFTENSEKINIAASCQSHCTKDDVKRDYLRSLISAA